MRWGEFSTLPYAGGVHELAAVLRAEAPLDDSKD